MIPRRKHCHRTLVSALQYEKVQSLIAVGLEEGATLLTGGAGKPDGLNRGYYVNPLFLGM